MPLRRRIHLLLQHALVDRADGVLGPAEDFAAQTLGLDWGQWTVAALESGRRAISLSELLFLPKIFKMAKLGKILTNGWGDGPRGTPTIDGDKVYALGGDGTLIAQDRASTAVRLGSGSPPRSERRE